MSTFPAYVFDASAFLALTLPDEQGEETAVLVKEVIEQNGQILVPPLFWYEVMNAFLAARRKGRITPEELISAESDAEALPIAADQTPPPFVRQRIIEFGVKHDLTFYDAAYLELAARHGVRLKTFDKHLLALKDAFDFIM